jgi:hypothetical protein
MFSKCAASQAYAVKLFDLGEPSKRLVVFKEVKQLATDYWAVCRSGDDGHSV